MSQKHHTSFFSADPLRTILLCVFLWMAPQTLYAQAQFQRMDILAGGQIMGASFALSLPYPAEAFLNKRWELHTLRIYLPRATIRLVPQGRMYLEATRPHPGFDIQYDTQRRIVQINQHKLTYDSFGRLTKLGELSFTYSKFGRLKKANTLSFSWDINMRITKMGALSLSYGNNGKPHNIGKIALVYDDQDRLSKVASQTLRYHTLSGQLVAVEGQVEDLRLVVHWDLKEAGRRLLYGR